jgi:acetyl esterase/lipase
VVDASFPPAFFAMAADDERTTAADIIRFFLRLRNLKVPSEIHVYQAGGHGFGIGTPQCSCAGWLDLFSGWLDVTLRNPASP